MKTGLIETCKEIVELEDFNLNMSKFKAENECGTAYCIAGRLAALDGYPDGYEDEYGYTVDGFDYIVYSYEKIGEEYCDYEEVSANWWFLFDQDWPNSLEDAKRRAQYIIDNGKIPDDFNGDVKEWLEL